jgi:hypothetical protein
MTAKYIVQMNMADRGQATQWTDCEDAKFVAQEDALERIEWMKGEYGDQIEYRVRMLVQDRKTGEFYNPQERFDQLMNKPEILAMLKRLAVR